ncbi:MAG: galactokinase [Candidatus Limnocylindria bacterium]
MTGQLIPATALDADALRAALAAAEPVLESGIEVVRAPGRVNLIGEHTDYNQGFVLPAAINLETWIAVARTDRPRADVTLAADGQRAAVDLPPTERRRGSWIDYVAGVAWSLNEAGLPVSGFRGLLASTLPISAGLSSSAALELASAWALLGDTAPTVDRTQLARLAQRAENEYVGVRCGLMDQFASAQGRPDAALLLDCRSGEFRTVRLPLDEFVLVVLDTRSARRLAASDYNRRRAECEAAVAALAAVEPSVRSLRDVSRPLLERHADRLEPVALRRARHVVDENQRVLETAAALEAGDLAAVGRLFAASHRSLRDLYEVSSPELDALVEIAAATPGVVASRMTGAGFGGCTINLVRRDAVPALALAVSDRYSAWAGRDAGFHVVEPAAGVSRAPSG